MFPTQGHVARRAGRSRGWIAGLMFVFAAIAPASTADAAAPEEAVKAAGGFSDPRKGDVPEGAGEMITPDAERAIQTGLAWLGRSQNADGSFGNATYRGNIAVTSLAGLAFMASGSSPGRGPYGPQIDRALSYVMDNTSPSGFIAVSAASTHGPMYSHGWGTLFLAEAYGMTHRPEIREKLQKAVRLIIDTQNSEGGWRYQPVRRDADISVTVCQINALRAARNAGLFVPKETVDNCIDYCRHSQNPDGGFRYMLQGGASAFPRSAAGVVALYSAAVYDTKEIESGVAYLRQFMPEISSAAATATTSTATITPSRRCGFAAARTGTPGSRRSATSSCAGSRRPPASGPTASATSTAPRWP